jgi:plasmid stability protein
VFSKQTPRKLSGASHPGYLLSRPTAVLGDRDIIRYHQGMGDVLIRDLPDDVLAGIDARAAELGLSRVEYIRRRLAQDARASRVPVTRDDLHRFGQAVAGLADDHLMRQAWQ